MLTTLALLVMAPKAICTRCKLSPTTPISVASPIAAKRAGVPDETSWLIKLINYEHGQNVTSRSRFKKNPDSSAYGLGQFIGPGPIGSLTGTWEKVGIRKTDCQVCQIEGIYRYCRHRREYGSVKGAVLKWESRAHYPRGRRVLVGGWY